VPTGGKVRFEGTTDGINWVPITLRRVGADAYTQVSSEDDTFIGSIITMRKWRVKVITAGSAPGTVMGRASCMLSTLEGIEHGFAPHNIGFDIFHKGLSVTGAVTGQEIYDPGTDGKFVVTGVYLSAEGSGLITIFDETDAADNWIATFNVKATTGDSKIISQNMHSSPFVSSAAGNKIKITTDGSAVCRGTVFGYVIPV
jgi:hypothetical protein